MIDNPAIRVEEGRASADKLVDLCLRHPLPDHITRGVSGLYLVDLPPDVKVIVKVSDTPDPWRPSRKAHVVYIYRNQADRDQGYRFLANRPMEEGA